jgi:hypothetical protein
MKRFTFLALIFATVLLFTPAMNCAAQDRDHDRYDRDRVEDCVDNTHWQMTVNGASAGTWVFHRDGEVVGIYLAGGVAWRGRWHQLGHHRYMFEFDYQGGRNVQYVRFVDDGERLLGYSDPEMRNLNREGTRSR